MNLPYLPTTLILKLEHVSESPRGPVERWAHPQSFWSIRSGVGPRICISNKVPGTVKLLVRGPLLYCISGLMMDPKLVLGSKHKRKELEELWQSFLWENSHLGEQRLCGRAGGREIREGFTKEVILELNLKDQEKFAKLARQGASTAEGTAGAKARREEKIRHIWGTAPTLPNSYSIFGGHDGADSTYSAACVHIWRPSVGLKQWTTHLGRYVRIHSRDGQLEPWNQKAAFIPTGWGIFDDSRRFQRYLAHRDKVTETQKSL